MDKKPMESSGSEEPEKSVEAAPASDKDTGAKEEQSVILEAKELLEDMKKQNKMLSEQLKKAERISAESILTGRAPARQEATKDEREIEAAREILKGTGYEDVLFPRKKK